MLVYNIDMSALLVALFALGIGVGLILRAFRSPQPKVQRRTSKGDKLDTVDEMFLYGEVTNDDFYRM